LYSFNVTTHLIYPSKNSNDKQEWNFVGRTHTISQTDHPLPLARLPSKLMPYQLSVSMTSHRYHKVCIVIICFLPELTLLLIDKVTEPQYPSLLRDSASIVPSEPFVVDKNGEMPEGAIPLPSLKPDPNPPMVSRSLDTAPQVLSSFPAYEVEDEIPRTITPEPIKVKRTKKKGVSSSKSKRTVVE